MFTNVLLERALPYSTGNIVSGELARGGLIREVYLNLTQQPTVTGAANTAAAVRRGGPWGVIKRLEIVLNGSEVVFSIPGAALPFLAAHWLGKFPDLEATLGDATTANPTFNNTIVIPFLQPFAAKPFDTVLDVRRARQIEVKVTWGSHLDVTTGATAYTTNPVLEVSSLRSIPLPEDVPDSAVFTEWRRLLQEVSVPATTTQQRIDLSTGYVYRGALIETLDAGAQSSAILNRIKVKSGATAFQDVRARPLRELARQRFAIQPFGIPAVYSRGQNNIDAWYLWDQVTDGRLSEAVDTLAFSEFYIEADVTVGGGATLMEIYPWILIPPRA